MAWFARRTEVLGHRFDSKAEADRAVTLYMLEQAGEIRGLEFQPRFPLVVNGKRVCTYTADSRYVEVATGKTVVEDVKLGDYRTPTYKLKRKLYAACYGAEITEYIV